MAGWKLVAMVWASSVKTPIAEPRARLLAEVSRSVNSRMPSGDFNCNEWSPAAKQLKSPMTRHRFGSGSFATQAWSPRRSRDTRRTCSGVNCSLWMSQTTISDSPEALGRVTRWTRPGT
ncbi:hypothetical protein N9L68_01805 [bacterium]|nr:hypothetical protein [bacterium]